MYGAVSRVEASIFNVAGQEILVALVDLEGRVLRAEDLKNIGERVSGGILIGFSGSEEVPDPCSIAVSTLYYAEERDSGSLRVRIPPLYIKMRALRKRQLRDLGLSDKFRFLYVVAFSREGVDEALRIIGGFTGLSMEPVYVWGECSGDVLFEVAAARVEFMR